VPKPTLNINMQRLSIKKERGRKHGISYKNKWNRWVSQNRKKNLLSKRFCIKNQRIIDYKELKFQLKILFLGKLLAEELLERLEFVEIEKQMKLLLLRK
jgi:hypothetical protein